MKLYNTLSLKTEDFKPIKKEHVSMYHCGPTVYNYAHIGNLRSYILADTLRRAFEYLGYKVHQVINITDVGHLTEDQGDGLDKVEERAKLEKKTATEIAQFYTDAFLEDLLKLNVKRTGTIFPKATDHIKEQISLIEILFKKGLAYKISDGIYFDTSKFKNYGKLGKINLKNLEEGARIEKNFEKKHPTDFALWKFSSPNSVRQQEWPSPWGVGFPGWHIECSAMSMKYLGETFDIHTGGIDHIPVHHNNEIAQSESVTGKPYAHYWLHNAFVNIESGKMAKSAENFTRLKTLEENEIHPLSYRYWLLTAHYASPVLFSLEAVRSAQNAFESIARKIGHAKKAVLEINEDRVKEIRAEIKNLVEDNLNTPKLIALLHKVADEIYSGDISSKVIDDFDAVLGLKLKDVAHYITDIPTEITQQIKKRDEFRENNNWTEADLIRNNIYKMGFVIEDTPKGSLAFRTINSLI